MQGLTANCRSLLPSFVTSFRMLEAKLRKVEESEARQKREVEAMRVVLEKKADAVEAIRKENKELRDQVCFLCVVCRIPHSRRTTT